MTSGGTWYARSRLDAPVCATSEEATIDIPADRRRERERILAMRITLVRVRLEISWLAGRMTGKSIANFINRMWVVFCLRG